MSPGRRRIALVLCVAVLAALSVSPLVRHLRAASLLLRFSDPGAQGALASFSRYEVDVEPVLLPLASPVPARLYRPRGLADPKAMVLVHGVHHLGIDEPRLNRFARAIAGTGLLVLTPQVDELALYRIEKSTIVTIGGAAKALRERTGHKVGLMGLSFAGGLALLAAADERWADDVAYVVAVGAHDDLARVLRFFATDRIEQPDGTVLPLKAHDYGALVVAAGHPEILFEGEDVGLAQQAASAWLHDDAAGARQILERLSPKGRTRLGALFDRHLEEIAPALQQSLAALLPSLAEVSPHGRLQALRAPCYLLHGTADNVIPASETLWLARDLPAGLARAVLLSPAIVHVELGEVSLKDRLELVHFLAQVLGAAQGG